MAGIGYRQHIMGKIQQLPFDKPIYSETIASDLAKQFNIDMKKARSLANVNLGRLTNKCLERYQKGIYYKAQATPFGKTRLNPAYVARDAYVCKDGEVIGYETGASFLNQIGLTTQIPKYRYNATNAFKQNGSRVVGDLNIVIRKPVAKVTKENCLYLQLLDAIENKDKAPIDAINPEAIIVGYMKNRKLEFGELIGYAKKYYRGEILLQIGEIAAKTLL